MKEDSISRQAAINAILDCCPSDYESEYECGYDDGLRQGIFRLKHLPTIDPVKHGKWNETGDRGGRNYACGCCRFTFIVDTCMGEPMWNYCPNCGAKMDGGKG